MSAIEVVAIIVDRVYSASDNVNRTCVLVMDIKAASRMVLNRRLMKAMLAEQMEGDL